MLLPLLLALVSPAQDRLPPATALPPPGTDEAAVLGPVNRLFAALAARDGAALLAEVRPDAAATVVDEKADGTSTVRHIRLTDFAAAMKPGPERFSEQITSPAIEIDGDMAMVWAPYTFTVDGKLSHCGIDHFGLVREGGRWRIASLAWTKRTTGCPGA